MICLTTAKQVVVLQAILKLEREKTTAQLSNKDNKWSPS